MFEVRWKMITLLQISCRMWQWKNFENRPVFDEVMCRLRRLTFFGPPCICYGNSVHMSVCLSHAWVVSKRLNIIKILSLSDRIIRLVFRHQGSLRKSDGFTAKVPNTRGKGSDFQPMRACGYILETVIDTGIFTMEDEYKFVCSLSNSAAFDDLEWPRTSVSRSQYTLKANILKTVLHVWF